MIPISQRGPSTTTSSLHARLENVGVEEEQVLMEINTLTCNLHCNVTKKDELDSPCKAAFLASFLAPPLSLMEGNLLAMPNMLSNCDDAADPLLDTRELFLTLLLLLLPSTFS